MITERVRDPMHDSFECSLLAFCTVKTSADYQLKPSRRTKSQTAYAVIVDILEEGSARKPPVFLVESLSKLSDDEACTAHEHMSRRIHFASLATKRQGKNKNRGRGEESIPAIASICRNTRKSTDKYATTGIRVRKKCTKSKVNHYVCLCGAVKAAMKVRFSRADSV